MGNFLLLVVIVLAGIGFVLFNSYNGLQRRAQEIKEALSNTSVAMVKKVNLINQLMDVVKSYQEGEQLVHLTVSKDSGIQAIHSNYQNSNMMMTSLQGMAERYPDLKADQQYHRLINNLEACERDIEKARAHYNACVKHYNVFRTSIPTVFVANSLGFPDAPYLDLSVDNAECALLKEFKTDDGERLNTLLKNTTQHIADGSKKALEKATETGKRIASSESVQNLTHKVQHYTHKTPTFFYMLPDATPKGPVDTQALILLSEQENWTAMVKISEVGTDDWLGFDEWESRYIMQAGSAPIEDDK